MTGDTSSLEARLAACAGWRCGRILDVRPAAAFAAGALRGAVSHPLPATDEPAADLLRRELPSIFLPPRHEPLLVVARTPARAEAVAAHLRGRGRETVDALALDDVLAANLPPDLGGAPVSGGGGGRLWDPPEWLARHADLLPPPALGPALDLGCGSGRACVWLAGLGYRVTGLDHQPEALAMGRRLADSAAVACRFAAADLRDPAAVPGEPRGLIVNFRFLLRPLLARLPDLLLPGGVAYVRTFRDAPGYAGHPQARHRLRPGELLAAFPRGRFEILAAEEGFDGDGRPAAGVVARRRRV